MGRRKIEIKGIKDDRNRSVTFLKRKGGLFKKAHELSVLCSVDVAVIIFGQNKKLYEFSSGDINQTLNRYQYYGQPHERKGPADFADKGGDDDEDEDEPMGSPGPQEHPSPPHHGVVQHHLQSQPQLQHMRHRSTPSASPPMHNGAFQQHHRMSTPQPSGVPRPDSRTHVRRQSSNLVPHNHPHPQATQQPPQQMNYSYQPQAPFYNYQAAAANMQSQQPQGTPPMQQHHHFTHPPPPNAQMQQLYLQDQRRQSMPANIPILKHEQPQPMPSMHAPMQPSRPFQSPPLPEPGRSQPQSRPAQQEYRTTEDNRQPEPRRWEPPRLAEPVPNEQNFGRDGPLPRPQSIDMGRAMRYDPDAPESQARYGPPPPPSAPARNPIRSSSSSTIGAPNPTRVNSLQSDLKRPQLSLQIPGEASDDTSSPEEPSPKEPPKPNLLTPAKAGALEPNHASGIVLPAPSPRSASAGAVLSAGATGPTNPFARPNLPNKQPSNTEWKDGVASPMSALPSRVMGESGYMSSPSSMFPELGFGQMHSNTLASPAIYQPTPINFHGPSFRDDPAIEKDKEKRRKSPEEPDGPNKKAKS